MLKLVIEQLFVVCEKCVSASNINFYNAIIAGKKSETSDSDRSHLPASTEKTTTVLPKAEEHPKQESESGFNHTLDERNKQTTSKLAGLSWKEGVAVGTFFTLGLIVGFLLMLCCTLKCTTTNVQKNDEELCNDKKAIGSTDEPMSMLMSSSRSPLLLSSSRPGQSKLACSTTVVVLGNDESVDELINNYDHLR